LCAKGVNPSTFVSSGISRSTVLITYTVLPLEHPTESLPFVFVNVLDVVERSCVRTTVVLDNSVLVNQLIQGTCCPIALVATEQETPILTIDLQSIVLD
jgi:hypothetical protein